MQRLLKKGGIIVGSRRQGGRDRRGPDGNITPDKFDPAAIEMLRKLGTKKGAAKTHYYPLAMATYDIMPPPVAKEKSIGEERIVNFTGAGLSLGEELDVDPATASWAHGASRGRRLDAGARGPPLGQGGRGVQGDRGVQRSRRRGRASARGRHPAGQAAFRAHVLMTSSRTRSRVPST